jgi:hypothetical protein
MLGPLHEGPQRRGQKNDGEKSMMVLSAIELMRLTRIELCDLAAKITNALPDYPESSEGYVNARLTLRNIRRVLARRDLDTG